MKSFQKIGFVMMVFVAIAVVFSSCYKKKDTIAVITVVDGSNKAQSGVEVTLDWFEANPSGSVAREDLKQTATTGGDGKASFNLDKPVFLF